MSAEELGRKAAEMRGKRIAKETCEYVAKELFRDIRRNFEKLSLATSRPANQSKDKKRSGEQGSVLPTGEPVEGWKNAKRSTSSKSARKSTLKPNAEKNPLDTVVPGAGDDDGAWNVAQNANINSNPSLNEIVAAGAHPEPLIHKRALMEALKDKENSWYPRANAIKGMRPMMGMLVFEISFLLHPVSVRTFISKQQG